MNVWKVILEGMHAVLSKRNSSKLAFCASEKYDDLRTWLAEEDRQAMDRFAQDLLKEVGLIPKRSPFAPLF